MDELAHTINTRLDEKVVQLINDSCKPLFDAYQDLRNFKPNPHLTIATKFCDNQKTEELTTALGLEFGEDRPWELEFSDFSVSGKYIFLNVTKASEAKMCRLHERALACTENIGDEGINGQPSKYPYQPHISLIKLDERDLPAALGLLKNNLSGYKTKICGYEISIERRRAELLEFPMVAKIALG